MFKERYCVQAETTSVGKEDNGNLFSRKLADIRRWHFTARLSAAVICNIYSNIYIYFQVGIEMSFVQMRLGLCSKIFPVKVCTLPLQYHVLQSLSTISRRNNFFLICRYQLESIKVFIMERRTRNYRYGRDFMRKSYLSIYNPELVLMKSNAIKRGIDFHYLKE